ncbi:hypothetical protein Chor_013619 [Crotalus horridus]
MERGLIVGEANSQPIFPTVGGVGSPASRRFTAGTTNS